jgi:broad specificity phosphatase PhoE
MAGDPFICPEKKVSGSLSERGIVQAENLRERLRNKKIDSVFSSPYGRALQTAEIAMACHDVDIVVKDFLHEWEPNRELEHVPRTEADAIREQVSHYYAEETWKTELGEGIFAMYERIGPPFLNELAGQGIHSRYGGYIFDECAENRAIAVFAHSACLGVLSSFLLGISPTPVSKFRYDLTGVLEIVFTNCNGIYYPAVRCESL